MDESSGSRNVAIDLFCGAGGLSCGLEQAGFKVALGVDFDPHAISTYKANHPTAAALQTDIAQLKAKAVFDAAGTDDITLIAGGPSCQGFSTHGKREEDDPRNFLFKEFVRIVEEVQPRFVLMENVRGLLLYSGGRYRNVIVETFAKAGYHVTSRVLCAADYGVPQLRNRIFFLGTRLDIPLSFPEPSHSPADDLPFGLDPYVTVKEAIGDLPLLGEELEREEWEYASEPSCDFQKYARRRTRSKFVTLHQANGLSEQAKGIARHLKEGHGLRSLPVDKLPERFRKMRKISDGSLRKDCTTLFYRLDRTRPAYTITCYFRNVSSGPFLHPLENRSLSYREAARLMSFPDSYRFSKASLPRQIGNAVPPLLAKAVGKHILRLNSGDISLPADAELERTGS